MPRDRETYWALIEAERRLRNALSMVRDAGRLRGVPGSLGTDIAKVADDLADAVALAAASRRRMLEEWSEPEEARRAA